MFLFLSAMSLRRTSKDLNSCPSSFLPSPLRQNLDKNQNLDKQVNSNVNKEFLPKNSSQKIPPKKNPPKKILPKNSFQKNSYKENPPKKILKKNPKNSPKNPEKIQTISQKIPKLKISNSLNRT